MKRMICILKVIGYVVNICYMLFLIWGAIVFRRSINVDQKRLSFEAKSNVNFSFLLVVLFIVLFLFILQKFFELKRTSLYGELDEIQKGRFFHFIIEYGRECGMILS